MAFLYLCPSSSVRYSSFPPRALPPTADAAAAHREGHQPGQRSSQTSKKVADFETKPTSKKTLVMFSLSPSFSYHWHPLSHIILATCGRHSPFAPKNDKALRPLLYTREYGHAAPEIWLNNECRGGQSEGR